MTAPITKTLFAMITSSYLPAAGRFLVSEPFMEDQNFQRTVVLLVEHSKEGSLGFVLNRRLQVRLGEVGPDLRGLDVPVFLGGPVEQTTLHYVHRLPDLPGARPVCEGVYWSGNFEVLQTKAEQGEIDPADILFFVGYSGWSPGQLDGELVRKSWIVTPEQPEMIFGTNREDLWRQALQNLGGKYKVISNYPVDPKLN
jgi:putative transcriptional regulator